MLTAVTAIHDNPPDVLDVLSTDAPLPAPCPECGYDLRGNAPGGQCPECGWTIDVDALMNADIPWQQLGGWRGFWRTVGRVLRHPRRFGRQATRPVDYRRARRFQLWCCGIGWLGLAPLIAVAMWEVREPFVADAFYGTSGFAFGTPSGQARSDPLALLADGSILLAAVVGTFLWLLTATGVASYFFHPRSLDHAFQDRALALSYYSAAPVVLMLPAALLFVACVMGFEFFSLSDDVAVNEFWVRISVVGVLAATVLLVVIEILFIPLAMLATAVRASAGRLLLCGLTTVVGWLLLFVIFAVGLPVLVLYAQMAYHALAS